MRRDFGKPKSRSTLWFPKVGETVITTPYREKGFGILTRMELIKEASHESVTGEFTTASGRTFERINQDWISSDPAAALQGERILLMLQVTDENRRLYEGSRYSAENRYYLQSLDWEALLPKLTDSEAHLLFTTMKQIDNLRNKKAGHHDFPRLAPLPGERPPQGPVPSSAPILTLPVQWFYFLTKDLPALIPDDAAHIVKTDCGQYLSVSAVDPREDNPVTRTVIIKERIVYGWILAGILSEPVNSPDPTRDRNFSSSDAEENDKVESTLELAHA